MVKPIHVKYTIKSSGNLHHMVYCGNCGVFNKRIHIKDEYCSRCGTKIDWSEPEIIYNSCSIKWKGL